jgi:hypothetical protein
MKTFQMVVLILSGHKFKPPNLKLLQKILLMFIDDHTCVLTQPPVRGGRLADQVYRDLPRAPPT